MSEVIPGTSEPSVTSAQNAPARGAGGFAGDRMSVLEVHGVAKKVQLTEEADSILIQTETMSGNRLGPLQARYLARKLYRLARKIEARDAAAKAEGRQ